MKIEIVSNVILGESLQDVIYRLEPISRITFQPLLLGILPHLVIFSQGKLKLDEVFVSENGDVKIL